VPLYEYLCRKCSKQFEALIFGADVPTCPACQSTDLERLLSVVAVAAASRRVNRVRATHVRVEATWLRMN